MLTATVFSASHATLRGMMTKEDARRKIDTLVARFHEQKAFYKAAEYNETQTQRDFIDPFCKALGWDVDNEQGYAETYRGVIHEARVKVEGGSKAPDYAFRLPGSLKFLFYVEAKKPSVVIKDDITPPIRCAVTAGAPASPSAFEVISVKILGSTHEQFLDKTISLGKGGRAVIEENPVMCKDIQRVGKPLLSATTKQARLFSGTRQAPFSAMKNLLLASGFLLASITANAQKLQTVTYADGTQKLNGLITSNAGKNLPGVLILPAWKGIDEEAKEAARNLQKEGYVAFVADIYGEENTPKTNEEAAKKAGKFKQDYALYQKRISLALGQLRKNCGDKLAVIGFCFGGTGALEAARGQLPVEGVVCIHGGLSKDSNRTNGPLPVKILVEHPAEDASVPPAMVASLVQEMNAGKADWQIITYADSKHTFTDPKSPDYNPVMAKRAWQHTLLFLKEILH